MLNFIEKIIKIPTYTGNFEAINECFGLCKNLCEECIIREVCINNYRSILFSNADTNDFDIVNLCHLDVVENEVYRVIMDENILRGRGVFDMKSFVVCSLFNLKQIIAENVNVKYGILVVSDEETGSINGTKYWVEKLKLKAEVVLDSDSGVGDINKIVKDTLGAITIKLYGNMFEKMIATQNIRNRLGNLYFETMGDEIDLNFDVENILDILKKCTKNAHFEVLMLNDFMKNNIDGNPHRLYKDICENTLKSHIEYITNHTTSDSRYLYGRSDVINHQATGGDYHRNTEWLDFESLQKFRNIQLEFLRRFKML
ncbi:MAG: M20/M25/M40 family metallo-hydrolase [Rickettsiales bacterium]|jgi:acetylornithine deacetylase/succinyl-diaminopimelate desuccinylase-like protein|nr:M20/M25/M40 family metallo-hydrolase [Rickettsiales bacterium]